MWADKTMPDGERRVLGAATAVVWLFALAVNVDNVQRHLRSGGASPAEIMWLRWAPDILLLVGAWKLRYRPRSVVAWSMLGLGVAWLVWAGLSMAAPTATGRVVALLPILVALLMTLALEFKHEAASAPVAPPPHAPVPLAAPISRDSADIPTTPSVPEPEPGPAPAPASSKVKSGTRRACPTREAARQILLDMDPLDLAKTSNAELGRRHGGSDVWWGDRRKEHFAALEELGAEARNLKLATDTRST